MYQIIYIKLLIFFNKIDYDNLKLIISKQYYKDIYNRRIAKMHIVCIIIVNEL